MAATAALFALTGPAVSEEAVASARVEVREQLDPAGTVSYEYVVVNTSAGGPKGPRITDFAVGLQCDLLHGELPDPRPDAQDSDWDVRVRSGKRTSRGRWYVWWTCDPAMAKPEYLESYSPGGLQEHQRTVKACTIKASERRSFVLYTRPGSVSYRAPAFAVFFGSTRVCGRARLLLSSE